MKPTALILVLVTAAVSAATLAGSSQATSPGRNGRIAYMVKDGRGNWQIWVANADLSGPKKLTRGRYDSGWPVWSPNGRRLAFDSNRTDHKPDDSHEVNDVFVMKPDGSGVKKLTDSKGISGDAAWSPKGSLIAFDADRGNKNGFSAIYGIRPNGRGLRKLTHPRHPMSDYKPRFSPDGTQIVFLRERGTADFGPAALFTMHLDGSHLHRLTPFSLHADDSDWSPDGKQIVFDGYPNGPYGDIYTVSASGGAYINVTHDTTGQADPVWSPDGQKILFLDNGYVNGVGRTGLATMSPDGNQRHFIANENLEAHQADWESVAAGAEPLTRVSKRPRPGQYAGTTSEQQGVTFEVSKHGKRVTAFATVDGYNNMCHYTGTPDHIFHYTVKVPSMKIKRSGSFTATVKSILVPGPGGLSGVFRVEGRFSSGIAHGTVTRLNFTCGADASNPTTSDYYETFTAQRT